MTIRHIVLFKLHPDIDASDPRVRQAADISRSHPYHIEEILEWWAGPGESNRDVSCDFMVMALFESYAALLHYLEHPHHREGVELWRSIASWSVIDVNEEESRIRGS